VLAKGRCFVKAEKVGDRYTHDQLLADQAAPLKTLIGGARFPGGASGTI
jgi:hypothetical protein